MIRLLVLSAIVGIFTFGCAKKPAPTTTTQQPAPSAPQATTPVPQAEVEPQNAGPSAADLLAQKIQDLLNQILGNKIYFDFDKAQLKPEGKELLSKVGQMMLEGDAGKSISVRIEGHTDEKGTAEYNLALGERRAQIVMEYLEGYGVASSRLTIVSYGEESPVGSDDQNRRAEFKATATAAK